MQISLMTPLEGFANDLADVIKLFYHPVTLLVNEAGGEPILHTFQQNGNALTTTFFFQGSDVTLCDTLPEDIAPDKRALTEKRLAKRLCKRALYALLKQKTGHKPPWGSLTGIRPTRLLYDRLSMGEALDEGAQKLIELFDLSSDKAETLKSIVMTQSQLPVPTRSDIDIYVSIPFCRTRCAYCSFPSEAVGNGCKLEPYMAALLGEIEDTAQLVSQTGLTPRAMYVGGGTPTALNEDQLKRLLARLRERFPTVNEFTVEAGRPDTLTKGKLDAIRSNGASRISINPQTMQDRTLKVIGRDHTAKQTVEAFHMAREAGFHHINMDVIAGLPGETAADFFDTLQRIIALDPESLTAHTLSIKRTSRLDLENWPLPDQAIVADMTACAEAAAKRLHMTPYYLYRQKHMAGQQQNVGYAKAGCACLYNVDIMEENVSILAMGAGAISKRVFPDRELRIVRAPNVSNVDTYISRVDEMIKRKRALFE